MAARLSICIPTYNRIASLKPLLEQLCTLLEKHSGDGAGIEICVSDNGSTDGTWEVLEQLKLSCASVQIRRNKENEGFGRNFWSVAEMATGDFIYFTGDDDLFREEALEMLLLQTGEGAPDLTLLNSHPTAHLAGSSYSSGETVVLDSLERYLEVLGVFHGSFIGNLLFRRSSFEAHRDIGDAVFQSAYPHLFPVFRTLREGRCLFMNTSITIPNDEERGWRKMQPVYTSIDVARIVREEVIPFVERSVGRSVLRRLGRGLPRAYARYWKREIELDSSNPYQSLRAGNLLGIYS